MNCRWTLTYEVTPRHTLKLIHEVPEANGATVNTYPLACSLQEVIKLSQDIVSELETAVRGAEQTRRSCLPALREKCRALAGCLLPKKLRETYSERASQISSVEFRSDPSLSMVPFELMHVQNDFLCYRYPTARRLLARAPDRVHTPASAVYNVYSILDPNQLLARQLESEDNKTFQNHLKGFVELLAEANKLRHVVKYNCPVEAKNVVEAIQNNHFVNLVLHHVHDREDPTHSGFVLDMDEQNSEVLPVVWTRMLGL